MVDTFYGIVFFVGFTVGWVAHLLLLRHLIKEHQIQIIELANKQIEENTIEVDVERYNENLMFYQHDNKRFICQVPSMQDFVIRFHELFPGKLVKIVSAEEQLLDELAKEVGAME